MTGWVTQLEKMVAEEERAQQVLSTASELLLDETTFPPPISPRDDVVESNETEESIRLWTMRRTEQLQNCIRVFLKHVEEGKEREAVLLGTWLYDQHADFGVHYNPALLKIFKQLAMCERGGVLRAPSADW